MQKGIDYQCEAYSNMFALQKNFIYYKIEIQQCFEFGKNRKKGFEFVAKCETFFFSVG